MIEVARSCELNSFKGTESQCTQRLLRNLLLGQIHREQTDKRTAVNDAILHRENKHLSLARMRNSQTHTHTPLTHAHMQRSKVYINKNFDMSPHVSITTHKGTESLVCSTGQWTHVNYATTIHEIVCTIRT